MGEESRPRAAGAAMEPTAGGAGGYGQVPGVRAEMTPGLDILYQIGTQVPVLALGRRPLADQAACLDALMSHTPWTADTLLAALAAPFEGPVRTSAGAVVSARINALPSTP
ncbi:hypothetical protein [Streptomyces sp. NPDC058486]|uniref:hypothetical protein n=1 Tax=unclassified Streptomyces TaxID=2593676 RepID=UPI003660ACAA